MGKRQRRRLRLVAESATATANRTTITEARGAPPKLTGERMLIQLIDPGWGSSGYYGAPVLAAAAEAKVWPAGTHMYLDHPTVTEDIERPERSVRDLAAVLTEDARVGGGGALVAEARVFSPYRAALTDAADAIGTSIRAYAEAVDGEAEGRRGAIITRLVEGVSVDFVTHAGRGGKILSILESARNRMAREGHGMTATDLRDAISKALSAANKGKDTWAYLRDYTDDWVVFELYTSGKGEQLMQQAYTVTDGVVEFSGDPVAVKAHTSYIAADAPVPSQTTALANTESAPVTDAATAILAEVRRSLATETTKPGGPPPDVTSTEEGAEMAQEQAGGKPADSGGTQASETATTRTVGEAERLAQLLAEARTNVAEAVTRAEKAEKRAEEAERRATLAEAKHAAEKQTLTVLATSPLKEASYPSVIAGVCDSLSLDDKGKVDEAGLATAITAEIEKERTRVAALLEAHGVGVPRDLGGTKATEADVPDVDLAAEFAAFGLSESMAKGAAAAGKGV